MVMGAKRLGYGGAKRLGLKIEAKRLGGKHLGGKTSCYREPHLMDILYEGDFVFISGRLRSASGRLFDSIFNASFQALSVKLERNFKKYMNYSTLCF